MHRSTFVAAMVTLFAGLVGCAPAGDAEEDTSVPASEDALTQNGVSVTLCSASPGSGSACPAGTEINSPLSVGSTFVLLKASSGFLVSAQVGSCDRYGFVSATTGKRGLRWGNLECVLRPTDTKVSVTTSSVQDPAASATQTFDITLPGAAATSSVCRGGGWFCESAKVLVTCNGAGQVTARKTCPTRCKTQPDPNPDTCE